jgi:ribose transport system permease protein
VIDADDTERATPTVASSRNAPRRRLESLLATSFRHYSAVWLLAVFVLVFGIAQPATFLSPLSLSLVLSDQVTIGMISLALLIPLAAGAFDVSVGANLALSVALLAWIELNTHMHPLLACVISIVACTAVGVVNGFIVVRLRVHSFIATLGVSQVLAALTLFISNNQQIVGAFSTDFENFVQNQFLGVGLDVFYLLALALILWYVLEHTPAGRYVYATGGNPEAARLAGVPTGRVVWASYVASGAICGIAGVIFAAKVTIFSTSFGPPLLFPAFAAVFFGSTQIKGRPNVWGTLLAMYALAVGVKGLQLSLAGGEFWVTPLLNGLSLLGAVILASRHRRRGAATL